MFNRQLENNPEQYAAVQRIVAGSSKPAPHLIFGPPGTGKTITLVEAMNQVINAQGVIISQLGHENKLNNICYKLHLLIQHSCDIIIL